jgi:hypothetical protein
MAREERSRPRAGGGAQIMLSARSGAAFSGVGIAAEATSAVSMRPGSIEIDFASGARNFLDDKPPAHVLAT